MESNLYPSFFSRHFTEHKIIVEQMVGGDLVPMIEEGVSSEIIDQECKRVVEHFSNDIEALVLGCTHYPVIESLIQKNLPEGVLCIDPAKEAANGLASYLSRHPEVEQLLQQSGTVTFHITKESIPFHKVGSTIW
ncbi:aspartate/glutamate racemase family protein [Patescibacteria group bacterium]|nr:aspartate/glutamate racemase family protein [Patescibacteria group bacterium]